MRGTAGTWTRLFHRVKLVGLFGSMTGLAVWYGCAGSNTDYVPIDPTVKVDLSVPFMPDLAGCVRGPDEDIPDDKFTDTNCDGVDGDISRAVFAAPDGDDNNLGTPESPVKTIAKAMALADAANQAAGQPVKVGIYLSKDLASGQGYAESVTLKAGLNLYGGFDRNNNWARTAANKTTIQGGAKAVSANNLTGETHIENIVIQSSTGVAGGTSSYGMFIINSAGPIVLRDARVEGGNGTPGTAGSAGTNGNTGGAGGGGQNGRSNGNSNTTGGGGGGGGSSCGRSGGNGGDGGYDASGSTGSPGVGNPGSGGSGGGNGTCTIGPNNRSGGRGLDGGGGSNGVTGSAAANNGTVGVNGYVPANGGSGTAGTNGSGGGGGGGGGGGDGFPCNADEGAGGGGGGAGGCGATNGTGGGGGGASVGIYAYASTLQLINTDITSGTGGAGGAGGNGASGGGGGAGGQGGSGADDSGPGGGGGNGGSGGHSGAGSGGTGGPSFGLWMVQNAMVTGIDLARIQVNGSGGLGGAAGSGPLGQATPGQNAISAKTQSN